MYTILKCLKLPDLLKKSLEIFFHTLWRTVLNLGSAWLAAKTKNKYSNKPAKGYKSIIQRFSEDLATSVFVHSCLIFFFLGKDSDASESSEDSLDGDSSGDGDDSSDNSDEDDDDDDKEKSDSD